MCGRQLLVWRYKLDSDEKTNVSVIFLVSISSVVIVFLLSGDA